MGLQYSCGMSQASINVDFNHGHVAFITGYNRAEKKNSNSVMGAFHMLPFRLHQSLITVSIKDAPKTQAAT